jgi:hypothetical protein
MSAAPRLRWPPAAGTSPRSNCSPAVARPPSWTRWTPQCSRLRAASRFACRTPQRRPWATRRTTGYGWILGQFALLGRTEMVRALLDSGLPVDTRGWSNFTPLEQAAMHGRTQTVQLLIDRGADLHDLAFDEDGPTPLDCAIWGIRNNRAEDGDYPGTVQALLGAGAPTRYEPPTGDPAVDTLLINRRP